MSTTLPPLLERPADESPTYESCEQCSAPVDAHQRYCVVCGTKRRHVHDPAAHFLAASRPRVAAAGRVPVARRRRSFGLGTALAIAAVPLAVALGVLVGRSGNSNTSKLLAALRAEKPTVVNVSGGGSATSTAATSAATTAAAVPLSSTFTLTSGYTVELQTLPAGSTQAAASAAEQRARAKGASAVGVITQSDFRLKPAPPAGDDILYSGQDKTQAEAEAALAKLRHAFPHAVVVAVTSVSAAASVPGKALSTTQYGTAHQITGYKPSAAQLAQGAQIANQVAKQINNNYVNSQRGLPDAISVP